MGLSQEVVRTPKSSIKYNYLYNNDLALTYSASRGPGRWQSPCDIPERYFSEEKRPQGGL
jgi:hypothetical protein